MNQGCEGCWVSCELNVREDRIDRAREHLTAQGARVLGQRELVGTLISNAIETDSPSQLDTVATTVLTLKDTNNILAKGLDILDEQEGYLRQIQQVAATGCSGALEVPKKGFAGKIMGATELQCQHPRQGMLRHYFGMNPPLKW